MTNPQGGIRARLIGDSLYHMVVDSLDALGWFDTGRQHLPLYPRTKPVDLNTAVELNTISFEPGTSSDSEIELGSNSTEDVIPYFIDIFAENRSVGIELSNDIRDILRGKLPDIGRDWPTLEVKDWREADHPVLFVVELGGVRVDAAHDWPEVWKRNWFSVTVTIYDEAN